MPDQQRHNNRMKITSPATRRLLRGWAAASAAVSRHFSRWAQGRPERIRAEIEAVVSRSALAKEAEAVGGVDVAVTVDNAFGKPTLISVDLRVTGEQMEQLYEQLLVPGEYEKQQRAYRMFGADLLERAVEVCWDNSELAPVAVRGRLVILRGDAKELLASGREAERSRLVLVEGEKVFLDMTSLGFRDEIARPRDLYKRYGPPASDPAWRP